MRSFLLRTSVLGTTQRCAVRRDAANLAARPRSWRRSSAKTCLWCHWTCRVAGIGITICSAELLRAELQRSEPDLVAGLHRRAAAWFEAEGLIDEAVRHLVAAGDIARSADLIAADWVNEFNGGGLSTVSGWLDLLPDETVPQDPRLSAARAWIALNVGQFDDAHMWIEAVEAGSAADTVDHGSLGAQLVALREVHAFKTGDVAAALEAARRAITLDFDDALQARSAACCIYGSALYFSGSIDEAQATFRRAVQLAEKIGDRRRRIYALGYLALIAAESGQLADAEHQIRRATGSRQGPGGWRALR